MMPDAELDRQSANSLERLYNEGRVSKKDIVRWVRGSAKLSGRVYEPVYRSGALHDRLWLRRREDIEERMFARRAGYWKRGSSRRDPEVRTRYEIEKDAWWGTSPDRRKRNPLSVKIRGKWVALSSMSEADLFAYRDKVVARFRREVERTSLMTKLGYRTKRG